MYLPRLYKMYILILLPLQTPIDWFQLPFDTTMVSTFYSNWNQSMGFCSGSRISMYILYNLGKYILQEQELVYGGL
jgi:hypothetical protein